MTLLALLCEKMLEAGWLAVLFIASLYFNVYSSRVFEPDKITLIRSIHSPRLSSNPRPSAMVSAPPMDSNLYEFDD